MAKAEKTKKKKSLFRRILKWTGISFLVLILALILIPIFFKDELMAMVKKEVNKNLKVKFDYKDFDLTFFSTFPNLSVQIDGVSLIGSEGQYKGVQLASIGEIEAHVGLWDVIGGDKITVDEVHISDATFDVRVDTAGVANYDIVKAEEEKTPEEKSEPSAFELSLDEYSLNNINLRYDDQAGDLFAEIKNLNHEGKGDLTAEVFDFETSTNIDELTFGMDGMNYMNKVKTSVVANLLMEMRPDNSKFTLRDNQFQLNNFSFGLDGFYQMLKDHDEVDLRLATKEAELKDILSLVPAFYLTGYEKMVAKAKVKLNAELKGRMDEKSLPGWDVGMKVNNATIQYPGFAAIQNVSIDAGSKFKGGENLDLITADVNRFHADFIGNIIDATLKLRNPMTDPLIDSKLVAKVNMASLGKVMPLAKGESYSGKLDADVKVNGRMSALDRGDYEAFNANGTIGLTGLIYKTTDLTQPVNVSRMLLRFTPKNLALEQLTASTGKSDFALNGTIDNYMGYVFRDELLKGNFTFTSNNLDLDQLMGLTPAPTTEAQMQAPQPAPDPNAEPLLIPDNVDFNMKTVIGKIHYNGIDINDVNGNVNLSREVASLQNMTMRTMGGTVGLRGSYSTVDHNTPAIDFGYNLKDIDIQAISKNFLTVAKLAPIAKYCQGKISSELSMKSSLTKSMEPVYNTLTGGGNLFTNMVTISGFEPLKKLSEEIKIPKLATQTMKDVKAFFSFNNGKVEVKPFNVKLSGIETQIQGTTSFEQDLDYKLKMNIPKEMIPASMIKVAEQAMAKVNGAIPGILLAEIPAVIPVNGLVGGKVTNPKVTTDFKDALLKATGNLKSTAQSLVNTAKDSVKTIINDKVKDVKEDLSAKAKQILDDAQKQADAVKAEGAKAAAAVRSQADREAQKLLDEAGSNPLKKKAAQAGGDRVKKEADKKAAKIESEANTKADQIMATARDKANALGK